MMDYACTYNDTYSEIVCNQNDNNAIVVSFATHAGANLIGFLKDPSSVKVSDRNQNILRVECEQFRSAIEDMNTQSEFIRKAHPTDLALYREIQRAYSLAMASRADLDQLLYDYRRHRNSRPIA